MHKLQTSGLALVGGSQLRDQMADLILDTRIGSPRKSHR